LIESQRRGAQNIRARGRIARRNCGNRLGQAHTRYLLHPIAVPVVNDYSDDLLEAAFTASAFSRLE
jgi:hypothetical protein